jgi:hypothetical protein
MNNIKRMTVMGKIKSQDSMQDSSNCEFKWKKV